MINVEAIEMDFEKKSVLSLKNREYFINYRR